MNRRSTALAVIVAASITATGLRAMSPQANALSLAFGRIEGIVTLAGSSDPIAGVRVVVPFKPALMKAVLDAAGNGATGIPPGLVNAAKEASTRGSGPGMIQGTSDASGHFALDVPTGPTTVFAMKDGYFGAQFNGISYNVGQTPVTVAAGAPAIVRLSLVAGGSISGRVVDASGVPMANVTVVAARTLYDAGTPILGDLTTRTTDDHGDYRLFGVPAGEMRVFALVRHASEARAKIAPIDTFYPSAADAAGALPVVVHGDDASGIDIHVLNAPTASVSGHIVNALPPNHTISKLTGDARSPLGFVTLIPRDGTRFPLMGNNGFTPEIQAHADGSFEFVNVQAGSYDIVARLPVSVGWGPRNDPAHAGNPFAVGVATVEVHESDITDVPVTVRGGVDVTGRVLVDGKPTPANVSIFLAPDDNLDEYNRYFSMIDDYFPPIAADGSFAFPLVPETHYRLGMDYGGASAFVPPDAASGAPAPSLTTLPANAYMSGITQRGAIAPDSAVSTMADDTGPIEVLIKTDGGVVRGQIDGGAQIAGNLSVVLVPDAARRGDRAQFRVARLSGTGSYEIARVPPGEYTLYAWRGVLPKDAFMNADFMRPFVTRGTAVRVPPGGTVTIDAKSIDLGAAR